MPPATDATDVPATKKARFSKDPDLKILVEDETFEVHSVLLMLVSPVFCQMLTSDMGEHQTGSVQLPGKSKAEFSVLMRFLQPAFQEAFDNKNVMFLSKWADEYQIDGLKQRCEDHIMKHMTVNTAALRHALECNLSRWAKQCVSKMKMDIVNHLEELAKLLKELPEEMMAELWPCITKAAGVTMKDMPPIETVLSMWPFIVASAQPRSKLRNLPDLVPYNCRHIVEKKLAEVGIP